MKISGADNPARLSREAAKLKKACQDFEAIFARYLLQKMRETVPKDGLLESSYAQETYQSMMDSALADQISRTGQLGLAEVLFRQLSLRLQTGPQTGTGSEGDTRL